MSALLDWCDQQDVFSKTPSPTTIAVRRAAAQDHEALLGIIEQEYVAFRLHHANAHTVDSPEGFGKRFRDWMTTVLHDDRRPELPRGWLQCDPGGCAEPCSECQP